MGFGGGGAVAIPAGEAGGDIVFDLQLGAGATRHLTVDFDIDIYTILFNGERNVIINPGPELSYFFGETGIFLRGGLGAAMNVIRVGNASEFEIGFDVNAGVGWEFFANNNLALGFCIEGDYIIRKMDDIAMFGFVFGLRYY